ncbi:MAG TPA: TetR/AcrR family transcriptional regulator [Ilumatobacteraceae bacterium]|nr:TetR/AcrR family transcriptional regulator [Ilumatobacteraceae bacterium]
MTQELRTAPRQRRSQQSIDSILDAAERLIHEQGQVGFTANELANAANMSIGRVYYWFPDMPSVVNALADRTADRLASLFGSLLTFDDEAPTTALLERSIVTLCRHLDDNPAIVALCLCGSGTLDYGASVRERIVATVAGALRKRVPDITDAELDLVSRTTVGITLGMLHAYVNEPIEHRPVIRQELVYVISAYLYSRYPRANDVAWSDPDYPIQPSRRPLSTSPIPLVHPALSGKVPAASA